MRQQQFLAAVLLKNFCVEVAPVMVRGAVPAATLTALRRSGLSRDTGDALIPDAATFNAPST
jgi:hypothetical protein